jgi:hypothetical protein
VKHHVLLRYASQLEQAAEAAAAKLSREVLEQAVANVPEAWLTEPRFGSTAAHRAAYVNWLERRKAASPQFVSEALRARTGLV